MKRIAFDMRESAAHDALNSVWHHAIVLRDEGRPIAAFTRCCIALAMAESMVRQDARFMGATLGSLRGFASDLRDAARAKGATVATLDDIARNAGRPPE